MDEALCQTGLPEAPCRQLAVGLAIVCLWVLRQQVQVDDWSVPDCKGGDGESREGGVVERGGDAVQQGLPGEAAEDLVEEEHKRKADILIEGVFDQARQAVGGEAAVNEQEPQQEPAPVTPSQATLPCCRLPRYFFKNLSIAPFRTMSLHYCRDAIAISSLLKWTKDLVVLETDDTMQESCA